MGQDTEINGEKPRQTEEGEREAATVYLEKIAEYIERCREEKKRFLILPYRKNEFVLDEEEITYIERDKRITKIHTAREVILTTLKMAEVYGSLEQDRFAICHNSFIVNLQQIRMFGKAEIALRTGEKIPVSRSHWKQTKEVFDKWKQKHHKKACQARK